MGVMVVVTVAVVMVTCVVVAVCVALCDQQRTALRSASDRLSRAVERGGQPPAIGGSRTDSASR